MLKIESSTIANTFVQEKGKESVGPLENYQNMSEVTGSHCY